MLIWPVKTIFYIAFFGNDGLKMNRILIYFGDYDLKRESPYVIIEETLDTGNYDLKMSKIGSNFYNF